MTDLFQTQLHETDDYAVLAVKGEIDISNADEFGRTAMKAFAQRADAAIIDASGLEYLDSAAIHVMFELARKLRSKHRELRLVIPEAATVKRVIEITGLHHQAPVYENVAGAVADLTRGDQP